LLGLAQDASTPAERTDPAGPQGEAAPQTRAKPDAAAARKNEIKKGEGDGRLEAHLKDEDIRLVLGMISEQTGLSILASKNVTGNVTASFKGVSSEEALTAILKSAGFVWRREDGFIYVGTPADFQSQEQAEDRLGTRLYRPNYVTAKELEQLITPLLTPTIGKVKATTASKVGIGADTSATGGDDYAGSEVVIVRDYDAVLAVVDQVVADLDRRPTQVAIEAMILSVKLDDETRFGVDFEFLRNKAHVRMASGSPLSDLSQVSFDNGGLKFGFLDSSLGAFLDAIETIGDANIIATPRLMCLNRQRAEFLVGAQLGYVSTTQTETATTQNVEFLEVGTQLRLRPFIASDGMVRLEIHPELSTGEVRVQNNFTLPEKEVTQVTSNVMVHDGSTVIIGGLIRDEMSESATQLPLLGSLPWVGWAFRHTTQNTERREILVLITPHIIYEPEMSYRGDKAAREFHHRHLNYADQSCPLGKRFLGRKYFHAAQRAWYAGNQKKALKLIDLSIHFDPLRRAALELRSDIVAGNHAGDHTDASPGRVGPLDHPLDADVVAPWVMDELRGVPTASAPVKHPVDPGASPTVRDLDPPRRKQE
jgi:type IV pilus assembly protein PilQ